MLSQAITLRAGHAGGIRPQVSYSARERTKPRPASQTSAPGQRCRLLPFTAEVQNLREKVSLGPFLPEPLKAVLYTPSGNAGLRKIPSKIQFHFSFSCFTSLTEANFITHLWTHKIPSITSSCVPQTRVTPQSNSFSESDSEDHHIPKRDQVMSSCFLAFLFLFVIVLYLLHTCEYSSAMKHCVEGDGKKFCHKKYFQCFVPLWNLEGF